jgi:type III pantothenate kinase
LAVLGSIRSSYVLPSSLTETADTLGLKITDICRHEQISPKAVSAWMVSSVVPPLDSAVRRAGERYSDCPVYFVPDSLEVPLQNAYDNPSEVGADRLVTAYAARELFPSPGLLVVDFGTATTLECIQDWQYLGGLICPGIFSSLQALGGQTSKLPRISLELDSSDLIIGRNTATSMSHGFIYGFAAMIDGLCHRLQGLLRGEITVVGTGGYAARVQPVSACLQEVRPDLLMQGLLLMYGFLEEGQEAGEQRR